MASGSEDEDESIEFVNESRILLGVARYLLPKVGKGVKTLVLECSKALTNGLVSFLLVIFNDIKLGQIQIFFPLYCSLLSGGPLENGTWSVVMSAVCGCTLLYVNMHDDQGYCVKSTE